MARGKKDKLYRSFNKGLITEAGFLTYPEDASIDELNTILYKAGNRSRRYGIDYEEDSTAFTLPEDSDDTTVTTEYFWRAPGNKSSLNFLVVQIGHILYFFDASVSPLSNGKKSFQVDLYSFASPSALETDIFKTNVQMSAGKGYLFVAQENIDPFTVEYFPATDSIVATRVYILIRDFSGLDDGLANDSEPTTLSSEHYYNLRNQGWVVPGSPSVQTTIPTTPVDKPPPTNDPGGTPLPSPIGGTGGEPPAYDPHTGRFVPPVNLETP